MCIWRVQCVNMVFKYKKTKAAFRDRRHLRLEGKCFGPPARKIEKSSGNRNTKESEKKNIFK